MKLSAKAIEEIKATAANLTTEEIEADIQVLNDPHYHNCDYALSESQAADRIGNLLSELMPGSYPEEAIPQDYDWNEMDEEERKAWAADSNIQLDDNAYGFWIDYCRNECGEYLRELDNLLNSILEQRKAD